jgi:hypothetical protein
MGERTHEVAAVIDQDTLPDFRGKTVMVYVRDTPRNAPTVTEDPSLQMQGGRLFLVGNAGEAIWLQDATVAVAWDSVEQYHVFESTTQLRKFLRDKR